MSKRNIIRIISFSLSIVMASTFFAFKTKKENEKYILQIENNYSYAFDELSASANNISTILNKVRFATTPACVSSMAAKLLTESEISKKSLSQLPINGQLTGLNKFFSQVGNFAFSLSKSLMENKEISKADSQNLDALNNTALRVAQIINDTRSSYNNKEYWLYTLQNRLEKAVETVNLDNSLNAIEEELKDYPTLIYDGPYSEHITEKESALLKTAVEINKNDGKRIAAKFAQSSISELDYAGISKGKTTTFDYLGVNLSVSVTEKGGYVLFMRRTRNISDIKISYQQAIEKAKNYLEAMGLRNLSETYYYESDGICTINFAYMDGKTLCYTDLIKVGIAMDTGEVMLYEAAGYISNHTDRAFKVAKYSESEAAKQVSDKLKIKGVRLALIPTYATKEHRCYEFTCISDDYQEILVYINAATLAEEEILILCKSDGGTLVK